MDDGAEVARRAEKTEKERVRKALQRSAKKKRDSLVPDAPRSAPGAVRQKLGEMARAVEPLGPGEATRQLKHATIGAAKLIGSHADVDDPELADALEDAGQGIADASKVFWPLRLMIRILIPLVIVGAFWRIGAKLVVTTPWWQRRQEKKREKEERERGGLRVTEAPNGEAPPPVVQPPRPGIKLRRKSPFT